MYFNRFALPGIVALAMPVSASAHNAFGDMGSFNNGFLHPVTTIPHVLLLLGLGLMLIFHHTNGDRMLGTLLLGFCLGFAFAVLHGPFAWAGIAVVAASFCTALFSVALRHQSPRIVLITWALAAGLFIGTDTDGGEGTAKDYVLFAVGACIVIAVIQVYFLWMARYLQKNWHHVAMRILASWIATVSVLYLAFLLSQN